MHNKIIYRNHLNEDIEFGSKYLFINDTDLMNFSWQFDTTDMKLSRFRKEIEEKELTISLYSETRERFLELKNLIFEIFEKDVLAEIPGKLWVGDYYLSCYAVEEKEDEYYRIGNYIRLKMKFVTDSPSWIKETVYNFYRQDQTVGKSSYPYGYSFDYSNNLNTQRISNDHFTDSNFILIVYGPVNNPTVFINGYPYTVYTEILEGERLVINSVDKTVVKIKMNGEPINEFNQRNKAHSVFKKIPKGSNTVSFNGTFDFEIRLFEERSEPKWI